MGRKLVSITLDNVAELPDPCRSCAFWEAGTRLPEPGLKDDWVSAVLLEWGSCGRLLYVDGNVAGFALYAPPACVAMTSPVGGSTVSDDAVLLMTARILPEYAAAGLGRVLIQSVVKDLMSRRGVRAIEAFADAQNHEHTCVIPAKFLTAVGFKTVHPHPRYPRLRLDLRSVLTWRGEVEVALERWLGAIRPEKKHGPVGVAPRMNPPGPWPVP
jgi:GNAT superfamily N-acetyltransferase